MNQVKTLGYLSALSVAHDPHQYGEDGVFVRNCRNLNFIPGEKAYRCVERSGSRYLWIAILWAFTAMFYACPAGSVIWRPLCLSRSSSPGKSVWIVVKLMVCEVDGVGGRHVENRCSKGIMLEKRMSDHIRRQGCDGKTGRSLLVRCVLFEDL